MSAGETVRVIVRCRPMNQREIDLKCQTIVTMNTKLNQVMLTDISLSNEPPKQFTFDAVYPEDSITENIYPDSVFPLVESVLEGYNGTVFAYGQTGCGKSFTMQGVNTPGSPQRGIIPRSFEHIFEASSVASDSKYLIRASYLEIYNETIRDLLGKDVKAALDLKEYADKGVQVQGLSWHECSSIVDCERLMDKGNRSRATGATLMNKDSSRSHSIFTVVTEVCTRSAIDGKEHIRAGKLNLVDLAGSERQSKTQAEGDRLREATRINLSLSALGNVISALVDGKSKHIPYRDSKLTRLLQDSLGGNTKTLMVAAISPAQDNYDETLSTLRYANRAKNIKNKPRINEDPRDAAMKLLQEEINRLKQELLNAGGPRVNPALPSTTGISQIDHDEEIEREKERLREEFERQMSEVRRQYETERLTKEEIQKRYDDLKLQYDCEVNALDANKTENATTGNKERIKNRKKSSRPRREPVGEENIEMDENSGQPSTSNDQLSQQEKLERLQQLQNKLIGGEEANNEERKKKRKKKLNDMQEKLEQRKHYAEVVGSNDDEAMIRVFDNVQDKLHVAMKRLEEERLEKKRLENDNEDLQREFERERQDYLNTIRDQQRRMLLFRTMIRKMSDLLPNNCNYRDPERICDQAKYDEEKNLYILPPFIKQDTAFPRVTSESLGTNGYQQSTNGRGLMTVEPTSSSSPVGEYEDDFDDPNPMETSMSAAVNMEELERRYARNIELEAAPPERMRNKRQEQLLNESSLLQRAKKPLQMNNTDNDYMNRRLNPFETPARLTRKYGFPTDKQ